MIVERIRENLFEPLMVKESLQESLQVKEPESEVLNTEKEEKDIPTSNWQKWALVFLILAIGAAIWLMKKGKKQIPSHSGNTNNQQNLYNNGYNNGYHNGYLR